MVETIKTKTITLSEKEGAFSTIFSRFKGNKKSGSDISNLRQLLSDERAKMIHMIKTKKPDSIYELAKLLGRDFKAVRQDIRLLEQFGLLELISSIKNGRERLRPVIELDKLIINVDL
ncbi:MAG: HTH domain-containing protein [Candidatus Nanoarchaeia archaeon]|nr:HTH domain-containing protein [Candidatus Nanoarchaeia archaeon]MDD5740887.1 HTH domain-containing protein [Candidatus Nanoarchaeia archaeon]